VLDVIEGDDGQVVPDKVRRELLEPFISATQMALTEMAGTEVAVRTVYRAGHPRLLGDLAAVLPVASPTVAALVLHFPARTASALAGRVLAGVMTEPDESMTRDCMGEVANVIAGQAKTLLMGTPHHFTLSTPTVASAADPDAIAYPGAAHLVAVLTSDVGDFALELCVTRDCERRSDTSERRGDSASGSI
jgi:chemotaxis protein CheX